jgi:type I restriction enzyme S subunit
LKKHLKALFAIDYSKIASGSTFAELKIFALKKLNLHYPPIELQNQFAERVQMIELQKQQAITALAKSEELFQGLLQQAFKGELN